MNENRVLIRSYLTKFWNLRIYEDSTPKTTKKHYNYFCDKHNNKIEANIINIFGEKTNGYKTNY